MPIYIWHRGYLNVTYGPYFRTAQDFPQVPRLSPAQIEATDMLEAIAQEPGLPLGFDLKPGDLLMANNHVAFHARNAFEDHEDPAKKRHLMRLWLTLPNGRPLPPQFENSREFGPTYARRMLGVGA